MFGSGAMTNSIDEIEESNTIFVIGSNTTENHPVISYYMKRAARRGIHLIVCDPRRIDLCRWATHHVQHRVGTDVALLNGLMNEILKNGWEDREFIEKHTEGFEALEKVVASYPVEKVAGITGVDAEQLREVARVLGTGGRAGLYYTMGITQHTSGTDNVMSCANLQMLLGNMGVRSGGVNPLRGQNNVQGACDMGVLPNVYICYQPVDNPAVRQKFEKGWDRPGLPERPGLRVPAMLEGMRHGTLRAFYCHGENLVMSDPHQAHTIECLEALEFLVVLDIMQNETTPYADVVLPCACWGEDEGTYTNTDRRVLRVRKGIEPPGESRPLWWIANELGKRMGFDMGLTSARAAWEDMRALATSYAGITWERCDGNGIQWPAPTLDHPGTPFLHKGGNFVRGLGKFAPCEWLPQAEQADGEYPLVLTTGRRLWHFHTGTMTRNSVGMEDLCPEELIEVSPADAQELGIRDGSFVDVSSRRGRVRARARVTDVVPRGTVFATFHFSEACGNVLTIEAFDRVTDTPEYKACAVRVEPS
jgi:predicted molibdopterin-dependent oxidoreductase YjgC